MFSIINIENALSKALTTQSCVKFGEFEEAWLKFTNQYDFLGGSIQYGFEEEAEVVGRIDFKDFENIYLKLLSGKRNLIGEWAEQIRIDMDKAGRKLYGLPEQVSTEEPMAEFDFFDENDDHTKVVIYKKDGYVYYDRAYYCCSTRYYYTCRFNLGEEKKLLHYIADNSENGLEDYLECLEGFAVVDITRVA